jgi:CubicO group peptidase (beta-lactamase class C family)
MQETYILKNDSVQNESPKIGAAIVMNSSYVMGAGNIISTVDDLAKWYESLYNEMFISKFNLSKIEHHHKLSKGKKIGYSYGWIPLKIFGEKMIYHDGVMLGFKSIVVYLPKYKTSITILSNYYNYKLGWSTYRLVKFYLKNNRKGN